MKTIVLLISFFAGSLLLSASIATAQPGYITTVAGNGTGGFSGDGGLGFNCQLSGPAGTAVNAAGDLYIADYANNRIRRLSAATNIITTIAGTGVAGYTGDGGPATAAELYNPNGVALDAAGNVYFADESNSRVRMINVTTGIITRVAGFGSAGYSGDNTAATTAQIYHPTAVAFDAAGDLYIADWQNYRVRKVTMSTGIITTVAGNGLGGYSGNGGPATAAKLSLPSGLAFDPSGNMYISEYGNNTVRKVDAVTGIITTFAGTSAAGYSGDGVLGSSSELNQPLGVASDGIGNIYIADWKNNRVRMVSAATSFISTIAGNGTAGYSGDYGPATAAEMNMVDGISLDATGNIYASDEVSGAVRKIACGSCFPAAVPLVSSGHIIAVYPNPATSSITITASENIKTVAINNLVGQTVYTHEYNAPEVQINIADLPASVYFLKINSSEVRKFIKE